MGRLAFGGVRFPAGPLKTEGVDARFDRVDRELALVKDALLVHDREIRETRGATR
ncbi:MAG: hypothetical protein ACLQBL_18695 [Polyangiaceae bacterium]|jgi:hypothetical protein